MNEDDSEEVETSNNSIQNMETDDLDWEISSNGTKIFSLLLLS